MSVFTVKSCEDFAWGSDIIFRGWVRSCRAQKSISFVKANDGSSMEDAQIVYQGKLQLSIGEYIECVGTLQKSPKVEQEFEIQATTVTVCGPVDDSFPIVKCELPLQVLRKFPHLRIRTRTMYAVMAIRDELSFATHDFFRKNGYRWIHTPIITTSDCEGAGEVFSVKTPQYTDGKQEELFFDKQTFLTVSGQLHVESFACGGYGKVYTFGPTFRAEKSLTSRHLSEFWMVEPEICGIDLPELMQIAEEYIQHCVKHVMKHCDAEITFLEKKSPDLRKKLDMVLKPFRRLSYTDAVKLLQENDHKVEWGDDFDAEKEKWIVAQSKGPVILHNYPAKIKAFYMKQDDDKTVQCMDVLVPEIGELIGGSMREDNFDVLKQKMKEKEMDFDVYSWYLDTRKYGSAPHGGFGLGLERLVMLCTGMQNIKDVIPFPCFYKHVF